MKIWKKESPNFSWEELIEESKKSLLVDQYIDTNHADFVSPSQMIETINKHYKVKYSAVLTSRSDISRVVFTSMVKSYQELVQSVERITNTKIKVLHVIGGGSKNTYLNQLIADEIGIPVIAGPAEATTIGNVLMQMIGSGNIKNLIEGRKLVRKSFNVKIFHPKNGK